MPRPDLVFVLIGPPELVARRKGELALDEIGRQMAAYAKVAAADGSAHLLDATLPAAEVAALACQVVASHRRHPLPRVGTGAQTVS